MVECKICKASFEDDKSLHGHLKAHKLHVFEYFGNLRNESWASQTIRMENGWHKEQTQ